MTKLVISIFLFLMISCNIKNDKKNFSPLNIQYDVDNKNTVFINNDSNLYGKSIWFVSNENGKPDTKIQFDNKGNIVFIKKYIDTILNGQSVGFYPNGNIESMVLFKDGKADGNSFYFFDQGSIKQHGFWRNDKPRGYVTTYFNDSMGKIKTISFYDNTGKLLNTKTVQ